MENSNVRGAFQGVIDHSKLEIIEDYMGDDAEFTVYFYV